MFSQHDTLPWDAATGTTFHILTRHSGGVWALVAPVKGRGWLPPTSEGASQDPSGAAASTSTACVTSQGARGGAGGRIRLSLAKIRRLFNVGNQAEQLIHMAMKWSTYRRQHQAKTRRHHFTRRLKIQ